MKVHAVRTICVFLFLVALTLIVSHSASALIPQDAIAGLWFFNEGDGDVAEDTSGNGNNGTLKGEADWVAGPFGSAVEFDGAASSYIEVADSPTLQMTEAVTVMFWVRNEKKMVDMWGDRQVIVGKHYTEYEVGIYTQGQLHTYTASSAGDYDEGIMTAIAGKLPDGQADWVKGEWFHVAWTLEGKHEIAYVNGVMLDEFDKATANTKPGNHTLEFGRRQGGSLPLTGAIDEVGVFNTALDANQVQQAYELGLGIATGFESVDPSGKLTTTWSNMKKIR